MSEGEPLRQIWRDRGLPESTVRQWCRDDRSGFAAQYREARRLQMECCPDEIVLIANRDDLEPQDKRVRIDTLKWLMSKLFPKNWGERLLVTGEAENPIHILHKQISLDRLSPEALTALEAFATAMLQKPGERT